MCRNAVLRGIAGVMAILLLLSGCSGQVSAVPEPTLPPTSQPTPAVTPTPEPTPEPDTVPPNISGAHNITVEPGGTVSYRSGVSATDDVDGPVKLSIDASYVDLDTPGVYPVVYYAEDEAGNVGRAMVLLTVLEPEPTPTVDPVEEEVYARVDAILADVITDNMTPREKAVAIFNWIATHMWYVAVQSDGWADAALYALKNQKGDCVNYWALSRAMLGRVGISTYDVQRVGGNSDHYWLLVDVGDEDGWYHFDPCPTPHDFPYICCLRRQDEVYAYSQNLNLYSTFYQNYYGWDIENCPVKVAGAENGGDSNGT